MVPDLIPYTAVTATAHRLAREDGFGYPLREHFEKAHDFLYDRYCNSYLSWYEAEQEEPEGEQDDPR